ncbi:uncharacterized protein METZ01_LOCUS321152, partial [marine metagenome]
YRTHGGQPTRVTEHPRQQDGNGSARCAEFVSLRGRRVHVRRSRRLSARGRGSDSRREVAAATGWCGRGLCAGRPGTEDAGRAHTRGCAHATRYVGEDRGRGATLWAGITEEGL